MKKKENKRSLTPILPNPEISGRDKLSKGEGKESGKNENLLPETKATTGHQFLPLKEGEYGFSREESLTPALPTNRDKFSQGEGTGSTRKKDVMKKKENKIILSKERGKEISYDENLLSEAKPTKGHEFLPLSEGEYGFSREGVKHVTNKISTVQNRKKPSANGFYIPAEGCISESRAVRACLMIRVFNN